jgi:hypothetical protein
MTDRYGDGAMRSTHTSRSLKRLPAAALAVTLVAAGVPGEAAAQTPPVEEQIAGAVLALPTDQRAGATVMGYRTAGELSVIRRGAGDMICLADHPGNETFHVACYHESLEPMMAMGRELTAKGIVDPERDELRAAAAAAGELEVPDGPAAFHSLTAPIASWNAETRTLERAARLHTVYVPFQTGETTGLSTVPAGGGQPWLMFPGSYRAHIMIQPPQGGDR